MNIIKLLRLSGAFVSVNAVIAGFYLVYFSGLGVEKIGYLPQVAVIGCLLAFANSIWNEIFITEDEKESIFALGVIRENKISMSLAYLLGFMFYIVALMLSMTVSFMTFMVVSVLILNSLLYDAVLKKVIVLDAVFFSIEYVLFIILGISAHAYLYYLLIEPAVYISLAYIFVYFAVLRVFNNINSAGNSASECIDETVEGGPEGDSIELSTEVDSVVYPSDTRNDYLAGKRKSDELIEKDMGVIMPARVYNVSKTVNDYRQPVKYRYVTYFLMIIVLLLPVSLCWIYLFPVVAAGITGFAVLSLLFPAHNVFSEKTIAACRRFFADGVIVSCILNGLIVSIAASDPLSREVVVILVILIGMILPVFVLNKYSPVV